MTKTYYECFECGIYSEQLNNVHLCDRSIKFFCDDCIKKHNQVEKNE